MKMKQRNDGKRRMSPAMVGILGATAAFGAMVAFKSLPQLRRYLRMKRM